MGPVIGADEGERAVPMMRPFAQGRGRCHADLARARSQAGLTLVESLVALLLASIVVLALAAGVFTMLRTTQEVSAAQRKQAALTQATESIKAEPFSQCATTATYAAAVPAGTTVDRIEYLDAPSAGAEVGTFRAACPSNPAEDRVQRITISIQGTSAQIVKRRGVTP